MKENAKKVRGLAFMGLLLLAGCGVWAEDQGAGGAAPAFVLSGRGDDAILSAKIEGAPLGAVLKELARQVHLTVYVGGASAGEKVSATFDDLPLDEGIKRLLRGKNYTLTYDQTAASGVPRVTEIRVVSKDSAPIKIGDEVAPVPSSGQTEPPSPGEKSLLEDLIRQALQAQEPAARIAALEALSERKEEKLEEQVRSTVASALRDKDPEVRGVALKLVRGGAVSMSAEALHEMALHDARPALRVGAWDELIEGSEGSETSAAARKYAEQALQDSDAKVRDYAQRRLEQIAEQEKEAPEE